MVCLLDEILRLRPERMYRQILALMRLTVVLLLAKFHRVVPSPKKQSITESKMDMCCVEAGYCIGRAETRFNELRLAPHCRVIMLIPITLQCA